MSNASKIIELIKTGNKVNLDLAKELAISINAIDDFYSICFEQRDLYKGLIDICEKELKELSDLQKEFVFFNDKAQVAKEREAVNSKKAEFEAKFNFYNDFLNDALN